MMRLVLISLIALASAQGQLEYKGTTYDGTASYTEIQSAPQLSVGANGLTVAVWMRPDVLTFPKTEGSLPSQQYVHWLGKGTDRDQEWTFRMYSQTNPAGPRANRISFYVFNPTGGRGCGSYFQDPITPGQWIHVVGVVDATAQTTARSYLEGAIGTVHVWNRALSAAEVAALFRSETYTPIATSAATQSGGGC